MATSQECLISMPSCRPRHEAAADLRLPWFAHVAGSDEGRMVTRSLAMASLL